MPDTDLTAQFVFTLAQASTRTVTLSWETRDGTAVENIDYVPASGQLVFQPGETSKSVTIQVLQPPTEERKFFTVAITGAVNATVDDTEPGQVVIMPSNVFRGKRGFKGDRGQRGMSAYEEAVNNGSFVGTYPQWLDYIKAGALTDLGDAAPTKGIGLVSMNQYGGAAPGQARPPGKGMWTDVGDGSNIWRFRDRMLVAAAAQANGADNPGADKTWVGYSSGGLMTYFETRSHHAVFSDRGVIAGAFASRSSDQDVVKGGPCIAVAGFARNDRAGASAWGIYGTAVKDNDTVKYTHGAEIDVANRGSVVDIGPYAATAEGQTVALWVRNGAETAESGQDVNPASAAIGIVGSVSSNAKAKFRKGIFFAADAIDVDASGHAPAIVLAKNQKIEWVRDGSGAKAGEIRSDATTSSGRVNAVFTNSGLGFFSIAADGSEVESVRIAGIPTAVNYIEMRAAAKGGNAAIQVGGADAVRNLALQGGGDGGAVILRDGLGAERVRANTTGIGFYGSTPIAKPDVTGSRGGNAALGSMLQALASLGLITNNSTT